jgi:hypothetical protein
MVIRRVLVGAAAGYAANRCMDLATSWFYGRQSEESRAREEEVLPGGALVAGGRDMARMMGMENPDDETVARLGLRAHRGIGMAYGVLGALLVGTRVRPMRAGLLVGVAAFVLVDEALNAVQLEPSPSDFPMEAHARGVVGHLAFGAALGAVLTAARPLLVRGSR